jgi:thioredoxin 1
VIIKIELIAANGCNRCTNSKETLRASAAAVVGEENLIWREVNILDELDYAVSLGVLSMPALAINGSLAFSSLPTAAQLETFLLREVSR